MATATGTLDISVDPGEGTQSFSWNGDVEDRAAARAAFDKTIGFGGMLASIVESPGRARRVTSFDEVERHEQEHGTVAVQISPGLKGG